MRRGADQGGLNHWKGFLASGGTEEQLTAIFLGSSEFMALNNSGRDGFVGAVYRDALYRNLDPNGKQTWQQALNNGTSPTAVAAAILATQEADQDVVKLAYLRFLNREPDQAGLDGFTNALQRGLINEDLNATFVGSDEYFARAQQ